jgi:hypothetical protein
LFFVFQSASFFQIFSTSLQIRSFSLPHLFSVSWISSPSPLLRAALLADGGSVAGLERRC